MKKILLLSLALSPIAVFAAGGSGETDILPRTVNFLIFTGIIYYLLADKIKFFLTDRTQSIQAELDKVQSTLEESQEKVATAEAELENAKKIAQELVADANANVNEIKKKISDSFDAEIAQINKLFDAKIELESKKAKEEIVKEVLEELLSSDNLEITKESLSDIISKKVA
jgi:F-type H+-transporting ATPase subunit b